MAVIHINKYKGSKAFLETGIPPANSQLNKNSSTHKLWTAEELVADYISDCANLSSAELRKKYKLTYGSWKDMNARAKIGKAIVNQEFSEFKMFLKLLGPRVSTKYSLDRIDNDDLEYAFGKVQWRDKFAQNSNKSDNICLVGKNGVEHTIAQWAKLTGQEATTLYKRYHKGWPPLEVIYGKQKSTSLNSASVTGLPNVIWPIGREVWWQKEYIKHRLKTEHPLTEVEFYKWVADKLLRSNEAQLSKPEEWGDTNPAVVLKNQLLAKERSRLLKLADNANAMLAWTQAKQRAGKKNFTQFVAMYPPPQRLVPPLKS